MHMHSRQLILMQIAGVLRYCQEIQFEIGYIEEMKTTCGNKEVPQTFSTTPNSSYLRRYVLIRSTSTFGNPAFRNFVTSLKAYCRSVLVAWVYRFQ